MKSVGTLLGKAIQNLDGLEFGAALAEWVTAAVPNDNITLLAYFQDRNPEALLARSQTPEVHADLDKGYVKGAYLLDPFHELHLSRAPSGVYRLSDIAPDRFAKNRYFIEYYGKTTMVDEVALVSYPSQGVSLHLCLGRDKGSNRKFSAKEVKDAHSIFPIVEALINRHWSDLDTSGAFDAGVAVEKLTKLAQKAHGVNLTPRQAEIVFLILKGHSSTSISYELSIAYQTVKVFRRQIYKKCNISSQAELFSMFVPLISK